jgi:fumarate hydratase class II
VLNLEDMLGHPRRSNPNLKKFAEYVERSLMLVTALAPVIGHDKASKIAHKG